MLTKRGRAAAGALGACALVAAPIAIATAEPDAPTPEASESASAASDSSASELASRLESAVQVRSSSEEGKEETVFVFAEPDGTITNTIVSAWLKNPKGREDIADVAHLSDITNTEGRESFTKGEGDALTWHAKGADIHYEGTTTEQPPVTMKVTYSLDGTVMAPEEIAGTSGHVAMRFDFENHSRQKVLLDGEETELNTPFLAVTGMLLDSDHFSNVDVTNAKIASDGDRTVVIGYALPGMQENLALAKDEVDIPESFMVSADVEDFQLDMTITLVTNSLASRLQGEGLDTSDIDSDIASLEDAMSQLTDGSARLDDGLQALLDSTGTLTAGVDQLASGASQLSSGAGQLKSGSTTVREALGRLVGSNDALNSGANQVAGGLAQLDSNSAALRAGVATVSSALAQLTANNASLLAGANQLVSGTQTYTDGVAQLRAGYERTDRSEETGSALGLQQAIADYTAGADQAAAGAAQLNAAVAGASVDTSQLEELAEGSQAYYDGLESKAGTYAEGASAAAAAQQAYAGAYAQLAADITAGADAEVLQADATAVNEAATAMAQAAGAAGAYQALGGAHESYEQINTAVQAVPDQVASRTAEQMKALGAATAQLNAGLQQLSGASASLNSGAAQVAAGFDQLVGTSEKTGEVDFSNSSALVSGASTLRDGIAAYTGGVSQLRQGVDGTATSTGLAPAISSYTGGVNQLLTGHKALVSGLAQYTGGASQLNAGYAQVDDGIASAASGASQLASGVGQLQGKTPDLVSGVRQLKDGSGQLADGLTQFDDEAVSKIVDAYNGDIKSLMNRASAIIDAAKEYQTFSGKDAEMEGSVKFVIETSAVEP